MFKFIERFVVGAGRATEQDKRGFYRETCHLVVKGALIVIYFRFVLGDCPEIPIDEGRYPNGLWDYFMKSVSEGFLSTIAFILEFPLLYNDGIRYLSGFIAYECREGLGVPEIVIKSTAGFFGAFLFIGFFIYFGLGMTIFRLIARFYKGIK